MKPTKLTVLAQDFTNCNNGPCPTLYRADDGRLFIQGYIVEPEVKAGASPPEGEDVVEVSDELIKLIINNYS